MKNLKVAISVFIAATCLVPVASWSMTTVEPKKTGGTTQSQDDLAKSKDARETKTAEIVRLPKQDAPKQKVEKK